MNKKGKEGKGKDKEKGIRKTIAFGEEAKERIEEYRREKNDIPSFTQAVNDMINSYPLKRERRE